MTKFKLYFDKDAETEWLNEMAAQGWAMKSFFAGFYNFEKCEKGEYIYQVDLGNKLFSVSDDYREFMEDAGVEIVQTWGFWVILRKPAAEGKFELYTDVDSSIEHYTKIRRMFKAVTIIELIILFIEIYGAAMGSSLGLACTFLIAAMVVILINAVVKTNHVIAELKERRDGIAAAGKGQQVSPMLAAGMLLNACALLLDENISHYIKMLMQVGAIILMLCGVYCTCRNRKR